MSTTAQKKKPARIVVLGDLVASKKITDRGGVQKKLSRCLKALNADREGILLSPYTITLGDEFQSVMSSPDRLFRDAIAILAAVSPVKIRFSFGIGTITTPINTHQAIGMDGPAFHSARSGMDQLKGTKKLFVISGSFDTELALTNGTLALIAHGVRAWKPNRFTIFLALLHGEPVKEIALSLGITEQAVYKAIDAEAMKTMLQIITEITVRLTARMEGS